jgi:ATP-dependent helicase HrpA
MLRVHALADAYAERVRALSPSRAAMEDVRDVTRMIEEFRVSLWAQQLGTARPVSEQRIRRAIDAIRP